MAQLWEGGPHKAKLSIVYQLWHAIANCEAIMVGEETLNTDPSPAKNNAFVARANMHQPASLMGFLTKIT